GWWEGQFFYRSVGDYILRDEVDGGTNIKTVWGLKTTARTRYFMGVYGSQRTRGQDVIRLTRLGNPNPTLIANNTDGALDDVFYRDNPYGNFTQVKFSVPEVMGGGSRDEMPYFPPVDPNQANERLYGAPDGYPDGIIQVEYSEKESSEGNE
ncbi:MAG TPA: hypothetical protein VEI97_17010, partial [bacterium]|nr:hypothetical protein [bacterium]